MRYAVERPVDQHCFDLLTLCRSAALERVDDCHRRFAFAQIAGHGFAKHALGGSEVEHIIHDLESQSEVASVLPEALFLFSGGAAENTTTPHTDREKASRFAVDQVEMFLGGNELAELLHLQQLAFDHLLREFDEHVEDAEIALLHGNLESLHVEPVASQHAFRVAPLRVRGRTPTAGL